MPHTSFFFAAHFFQKYKQKSSSANTSKTTPARKFIFFAKDGEGKSLQKKKIRKNCKIFDISFLQHTVEPSKGIIERMVGSSCLGSPSSHILAKTMTTMTFFGIKLG